MLQGSVYINTDACNDVTVKLGNIALQLSGIKAKIYNNIYSLSNYYGKYYKSRSIYYVGEAATGLQGATKCIHNAVEVYLAANEILSGMNWSEENKLTSLSYDQLCKIGLNKHIDGYASYDSDSRSYTYNWSAIKKLLAKDSSKMLEAEYQILVEILNTMIDNDGNINTDALGRFVSAGYTKPSDVTSNDFHQSFFNIATGGDVGYTYLQNKSFLGDNMKKVIEIYKTDYGKKIIYGKHQNHLDDILSVIAENYPVIEWRREISPLDIKNGWNGKYVDEDILDEFNSDCRPKISIVHNTEYNDVAIGYYNITSNTYNIGNVLTARREFIRGLGDVIIRESPEVDNYLNRTTSIFYDCKKDSNAQNVGITIKGSACIAGFYKEFSFTNALGEAVLGEAIDGFGAVVEGATNTAFPVTTVVCNAAEIYSEWRTTEIYNQSVDANLQEIFNLNSILARQNDLGLVNDTMVVTYDHVTYNPEYGLLDNDYGIKVDNSKDISMATEVSLSLRNYSFDPELLRKQYNTRMKTDISAADFYSLQQDAEVYFTTGKRVGKFADYLATLDKMLGKN